MGRNELEVKKERFKIIFQGLYLQKIKPVTFFDPYCPSAHVKDKKGQTKPYKYCNLCTTQQLSQKRSSEVVNKKKNKESVDDHEEGEDEEDGGNNSHENKVVDENTTQYDHINIFEKKDEMLELFQTLLYS